MGRAGAGSGKGASSGGNNTKRMGGGHRVGAPSSSGSRARGGSRGPSLQHSVGGNSTRRIGGGHRAGTSSSSGNHRRSGSFNSSSRRSRGALRVSRGGQGMPPPPPRRIKWRTPSPSSSTYMGQGMQYSTGRGGGCLTVIVLFIVIIFAIGKLVTSLSSSQNSTIARKKIDTNNAYINDCVIDELGWFDSVSKTERQLKNFWKKTGVQPYIILRNYDAGLITDSEKEQWAIDYYDENFSTENIFLFVYFAEEDTDNDVGYMAYANGYETSSVMDLEAVEVFWNNIDKYWYTDLSTDDVIVNAFNDTSDTIMHVSRRK